MYPTILKSITYEDSGQTNEEQLSALVLKSSPFLTHVNNTNLTSNTTHVPIVNPPGATDTTFTLTDLEIVKTIVNVPLELTRETIEDAAINVDKALVEIIIMQTRLKVETAVCTQLLADIPASVVNPDPVEATITLVGQFAQENPSIMSPTTPLIVLCNYNTYMMLLASQEINNLRKGQVLVLVPTAGFGTDNLAVLHPYGARAGIDIKPIEIEKQPGRNRDIYHIQTVVGSKFAPQYVKRTTI